MIADLAYWFKWPLSEISSMGLDDIVAFHDRAMKQADAQAKAMKGR